MDNNILGNFYFRDLILIILKSYKIYDSDAFDILEIYFIDKVDKPIHLFKDLYGFLTYINYLFSDI